jgi:hypothetical protein
LAARKNRDDIDLLCRIGGIRPTVADMLAPARARHVRDTEHRSA